MYTHEREEVTKLICKELGKKDKKTQEKIMSGINKFFENRVSMSWDISDVMHVAEERGYEVSDEDAHFILGLLVSEHDANIGINWDTIEYWMDHHCESK